MSEIISLLGSVSPYVFAFASFMFCFGVLIKIIRDERGENRDAIRRIEDKNREINTKLERILTEIAFKQAMEREK